MLDFPSFTGDDPVAWLYKANWFFLFYNTLIHHKLRLASFHMEEKAMVWYQDLEDLVVIVDWESFVKVFLLRFGLNTYDDPMETLTILGQVGFVEDYKMEFELVYD